MLRTRKKKEEKKPPMTNAEKCKARRERRKLNANLCEIDKAKKKQANQLYYASLTPEMKEQRKLNNTQAQRERRQKLKEQQLVGSLDTSTDKTPKKRKTADISTPRTYCTRNMSSTLQDKIAEKREKNRLSQQKRRQKMHPQKKKRELRLKRERYHRQKEEKHQSKKGGGKLMRIARALFSVKRTLSRARSKMSLWKLGFVKKLLARKDPSHAKELDTFYKRQQRHSFAVETFLEKAAVDYPGQKGSSTPKKVLTTTMEVLLRDFKLSHPGMRMSLTTFKRRRPRNILLSSSRKFSQCLCETCANGDLMINAINRAVRQESKKLPSIETLVRKTLCEPVRRACVDRECSCCGVDSILEQVRESVEGSDDKEVKWYKWEKTDSRSKDLVEKSGALSDLANLFGDHIQRIALHVFVAHWQKNQYRELKETLPQGHAILTVDFAENYLCKFQNETQSAHWSYRQVTVHPCVFFYRCNESDCFKTVTDYVTFLSDELRHDSDFTMHIFDKCIEKMKARGISVLHIFSDGCGSQYKSRFTFKNLSDLQKRHPTIRLTRHFFGSSHGKSMCDSSGGVVKNACTRAVASGLQVIQSAQAMYDYCSKSLTESGPLDCSLHSGSFLRSFVLVKPKSIPRLEKPALLPVKGTLAIHSVKFSPQGTVQVRDMSCFCGTCLVGEREKCANEELSGLWKEIVLIPSEQKKVRRPVKRKNGRKTNPEVVHDSPNDPSFVTVTDEMCTDVSVDRYEFFANLQQQLSNCSKFDELQSVVKQVNSDVDNFKMPQVTPKRLIDVGIVDKVAKELVPDFLKPLFPVLTVADGNCVPRALSLVCFGDQDHHIEIRCRIVMELAANCHDYLCLDSNDLNLLHMLSDSCSSDVQETFQLETMKVAHSAMFMGMWQFMAAANVIGSPIFSAYPIHASETYRKFFTRKLLPRICTSSHTVTLLWSATLEHSNRMPKNNWTANHVVPLMGLAQVIEIESGAI